MREFVTTSQAILHHATERPHDDAIVEYGSRISYRKVAFSIAQFTDALEELGVAPGQLVVIRIDTRFIHWMIALACERIGAPSVTLMSPQLNDDNQLYRQAAWIFADTPVPAGLTRRSHHVSRDWLAATFQRPVHDAALAALADPPANPAAIVRYTLTSGTTGEPKVLRMTAAMFVRQSIGKTRDCPLYRFERPRFLSTYGFQVRAAHTRASGCLLLGGTVIFTTEGAILADLRQFRPHCAAMVTGTVAEVMRSMPPDWPKPKSLALSTTGAPLGAELRAEVLRRLATEVIDLYSTSEASSVAIVGDDGIGTVLPNTEVAIIDEAGTPVPDGTAGVIKIRNDTTLDGYVGDPVETARHFRDGWFVTNDLGVVPAPGKLRLLGRRDDMLTVGGIKQLPFPIEERLRAIPGVREVVVLAADDHTLGAIVELAAGTELDPLLPAIRAILVTGFRRTKIRATDAMPRTSANKPDRRAAAVLFAKSVEASASGGKGPEGPLIP